MRTLTTSLVRVSLVLALGGLAVTLPATVRPAVAAVPRTVPSAAVVVDPTGDTAGGDNPSGDLTTMQFSGAQYAAGDVLSVYTERYDDPTTSAAWTRFGTTVTWDIDLDRDGTFDETATFYGGSTPRADLRRASDGNLVCDLTPEWGVQAFGTVNPGAGYGVQVPVWCQQNAQITGVRATIDYHVDANSEQTDSAPDTGVAVSGHTGGHQVSYPVLVSRGQWYNSPSRTSDTGNYFGNPGDTAVNSWGGIVYPSGADDPFFSTRKVVMRQTRAGAPPTFFRQYRENPPFLPTSREFVASFGFGNPGDVPVSGDWNGDGFDTLGLFRPSTGQWFLTDDPTFSNAPGAALTVLSFGSPGDVPVAGAWTGSTAETPGVFRQGRWYFLTSLHSGTADRSVLYGNPGDVPVPGYWTGASLATVAVWRAGHYLLADNNNAPVAVGFYDGGTAGDQFPRPSMIY